MSPASSTAQPDRKAPGHAYTELRIWSEALWDAMKARISIENRNRSGTIPKDVLAVAVDQAKNTEKVLAREMKKALKRAAPEVHEWIGRTPGIGEHLVARLVGCIGHPVIATPYHWHEGDPPEGHECDGRCKPDSKRHLIADPIFLRNVAKLWAYAGAGDPELKKSKGMTQADAMRLGKPKAKTLLHMVSEGTIKEAGRKVEALRIGEQKPEGATWVYRKVYEEMRVHYWIERPDWTDGHQHMAALRVVKKEILKDLWIVSRDALEHA